MMATWIKIQFLKFFNSILYLEKTTNRINALKNNIPEVTRASFTEISGNATVGELPALITKEQYKAAFNLLNQEPSSNINLKNNDEKAKEAFDFVVRTRQFEIDLYWKRATYFWTFIAAIFVAYVALRKLGDGYEFETLLITAIGTMLSFAWYFSNLGSKSWQRHWEKHLDLMEDDFMGPLYKTVNVNRTFSVSKINEIVSFVFIGVWISLLWNVLSINYKWAWSMNEINWIETFKVVLVCVFLILTLTSMVFGKGRGRFKAQKINMYRRDYKFD